MKDPYKRLEEIKQELTLSSARILINAYIQLEQSRYMNMGYDPGTAVEMAIAHLDKIVGET